MTVPECYLSALGVLCAAGDSAVAVETSLRAGQPEIECIDAYGAGRPVPLGRYRGKLPELPLAAPAWQSRNNRFAYAALQQIMPRTKAAVERYGAARVGVIIGTSTAGIAESEIGVRALVEQGDASPDYHYAVQEMGACAQFVAAVLGVSGPVYGISTACSSGSKALAAARRLLRAGLCDAVVAGGVDTLCQLTVMGFSSLEAVSDRPCNPFSVNRDGINIGEGAGLFLVTGEPGGIRLSGAGESSDAHHISAPDPSGAGAVSCMRAALDDARVTAAEVDYVNLHGTATPLNDEMESRALEQVFGLETPCSSTKPFTGHTLGAAGAVEAAICWIALMAEDGWLPAQIWDGARDCALPHIRLVEPGDRAGNRPRFMLSNSFAFGGNNISLLLERVA